MNTKEKIIDTMYHMIAKYGYDKTSIGMICNEIGIKKPSVYYYFKNKEEILLHIIDQFSEYNRSYDVEKEFQKESFQKDLVQAGWNIIDAFESDEEFAKVVSDIYNQSCRIPAVNEALKTHEKITLNYFHDVLIYGIKLKAIPRDIDVELNKQMLASVIDYLEMMFIFDAKYRDKEIWETTVNRMFLEFDGI